MHKRRTHILTFGTPDYGRSLTIQAEALKRFSDVSHIVCGPDHPAVQQAMSENPNLFAQPRGFGYWIWKYYLLLDAMKHLPDGDHLIYLDAGIAPVADMTHWFKEITQFESCFFRPDPAHLAAHWTKRDCFIQLECDAPTYHNAPILSAGIQSYIVGDKARDFLSLVKSSMQISGVLDDSANQLAGENLPGFVEHRHDQSVLSLLVSKHQHPVLIEPTQYGVGSPPHTSQVLDVHRLGRKSALSFFLWRRKRRRRMFKLGHQAI